MPHWFRRTGRGLLGLSPIGPPGWSLVVAFVVVLVGARLALDASGRAVHAEYIAVLVAVVTVFALIVWRTSEPRGGGGA